MNQRPINRQIADSWIKQSFCAGWSEISANNDDCLRDRLRMEQECHVLFHMPEHGKSYFEFKIRITVSLENHWQTSFDPVFKSKSTVESYLP